MFRFTFQKALSLFAAVVLASVLLSSLARANQEQAKQADKFIDSMCVNTHPWYEWERIKPKLQELGIRHLRGGEEDVALLKQLYKNYGIKYTMIVEPKNFDSNKLLSYVKSVGTEKFDGISGPNEPSLFIKKGDWQKIARSIQEDLWKNIKGDPKTKNIPVLTPSPVFPQDALQLGDVSAWADYADIHLYYGGKHPETLGDPWTTLYWKFRGLAGAVAPGKPVIMTETGYHNTRQTDGHVGTPDLEVVAKYIPRLYLTHWKRGIVRSCIYELYDEGTDPHEQEDNFGLLHHDYSNKPSFDAVKNTIALLKDPGADFEPGSLDFSLSGNTKNVETLLLQKRNGNFFLSIWLGVSSFEPRSQSALNVRPQVVAISLPNPIESVVLHRLSAKGQISSEKVAVSHGRLQMQVSDTVTFVEIELN
jgi:hypothetical protein